MLTKKQNGVANGPRMSRALSGVLGGAIDRRTFLRRSGLTAGGAALASTLPLGMVKTAESQTAATGARKLNEIKSVCTHCSVGCTVVAEVDNGVWVGQEPGFDSPFNLGGHCCKGAAVREHAHGDRRLKYPMKLTGGKWKRMSWDDAINEIGDGMLRYLVHTANELLKVDYRYAVELEEVMSIRDCTNCQASNGCPCDDILDVGCAYHRIKYAKAQARK